MLSAIPFCLGFVMILFDDRRRALHDRLVKTVVVYRAPPSASSRSDEVALRRAPWLRAMEWVALVLWLTIAGLAMALGAGAIAQLAFGVQAPAVLAALALTVVFIVTDGTEWVAWAALGCTVVAALAVAVGAAWVVSGDRSVSYIGQTHEETLAAIAGIELPLLMVMILIHLGVALGLTAT